MKQIWYFQKITIFEKNKHTFLIFMRFLNEYTAENVLPRKIWMYMRNHQKSNQTLKKVDKIVNFVYLAFCDTTISQKNKNITVIIMCL